MRSSRAACANEYAPRARVFERASEEVSRWKSDRPTRSGSRGSSIPI
jgi:hypothetical protein